MKKLSLEKFKELNNIKSDKELLRLLKKLGKPATVNSGYEPIDIRFTDETPVEQIARIQKKLKKKTLRDIVLDDIREEVYLKRIRKL